EVGRLLDYVHGAVERPTIVVVTADHGEEFHEHGGAYHGSSLYDEQVRVPLFFVVRGLAARRVGPPVDLVDLAPTILGLLRVEAPGRMRGHDLRPLLAGVAPTWRAPVFATVMQKKMIVVWPYKLVADLRYGLFELYDRARF